MSKMNETTYDVNGKHYATTNITTANGYNKILDGIVNNHASNNITGTSNINVEYKTIEIKCQAMKKTFGLFDHYFMVIDGVEYHTGAYSGGKILKDGQTKGAHTTSVRKVCKMCYDKIIAEFYVKEDLRLFNTYFPFINCESICEGFSVQSLLFFTIPFICLGIANGNFILVVIIILVSFLFVLMYSKYKFSRTHKNQCSHLDPLLLETQSDSLSSMSTLLSSSSTTATATETELPTSPSPPSPVMVTKKK